MTSNVLPYVNMRTNPAPGVFLVVSQTQFGRLGRQHSFSPHYGEIVREAITVDCILFRTALKDGSTWEYRYYPEDFDVMGELVRKIRRETVTNDDQPQGGICYNASVRNSITCHKS